MKHANVPTPEQLSLAKSRFYYDAEAGTLNSVKTGKPITKNNGRYIQVRFGGITVVAHRLVWFMCRGAWPVGVIDHRNGNTFDNRISNLRLGTQSDNNENQRRAKSCNVSGYLGVSKHRNKFRASIAKNGVRCYIGLFDSAEAAHLAYLSKKREMHGFNGL